MKISRNKPKIQYEAVSYNKSNIHLHIHTPELLNISMKSHFVIYLETSISYNYGITSLSTILIYAIAHIYRQCP